MCRSKSTTSKANPLSKARLKKVLVIGASTGYGLASRIVPAFSGGAATIGVFFEKEGTDRKPGSPGWYNSVAFEEKAKAAGLYARSFNGDAFSNEMKEQVIAAIKEDLGQVDMIVYSLASPRRTDPADGGDLPLCSQAYWRHLHSAHPQHRQGSR